MLYVKEGFPEENEFVKCTVKRIYGNTVFVYIDEYDKDGVLTIAEIAPGRIRNIRDYVVENKTIVCKVLRVIPEKNHVDVSLRRVPLNTMKEKLEEIKKENFAEKVYEEIANRLKTTKDKLFERTYEDIFESYDTVHDALRSILDNEENVNLFSKLNENEKEVFKNVVLEWIKPSKVFIKKNFKLKSYAPQGIDQIKEIINKGIENTNYDNMSVCYLAAGKYQIRVTHQENKEAQKVVNNFLNFLEQNQKKYNVVME